MLAEFRDYLKQLNIADNYSIGKIDNSKEKSIGIYGASNAVGTRIEAVGKDSSYDRAGVRILLHWNRNMKESEAAARVLYESIRYITGVDMDGIHVQYLDLLDPEPRFIDTDENGVYEYVISAAIYYRRVVNGS